FGLHLLPGVIDSQVHFREPGSEAKEDLETGSRAAALGGRVTAIAFDSRLERLLQDAEGVVAMGGYNTFCEVLSFDKPAVIAPRTSPRLEQYIRAHAASTLGLVRMLPTLGAAGENRDPKVMADAIRNLPTQRRPSAAHIPGLLGGLDAVVSLTSQWLGRLQAAE
ncbi:MAG: glycosyltransferase, partial [Pseudomonadota bacterium]